MEEEVGLGLGYLLLELLDFWEGLSGLRLWEVHRFGHDRVLSIQ